MMDKLKKYWTITPPVYLKHQANFNGVTITPKHNEKQVLRIPKYEDDFISITPIKEQTITRKFGDLLAEEV